MFGDQLKKVRKQSGLSQKSLAAKLFVSQQSVWKWEKNESSPNPETIAKMAEIFGVSADYLLGREETEKPTPVSESGPLYPPEYDLLNPEDKELVDGMIRSLAKKKSAD